MHLISFGDTIYSSDSRYELKFKQPNDWQLHIQFVNERDEGQLECQINTQPTLVLVIYLNVVGKSSRKLSLTEHNDIFIHVWSNGGGGGRRRNLTQHLMLILMRKIDSSLM